MPKSTTKINPLLAAWQPSASTNGKPFALAKCDPAAKPFSSGDKDKDKAAVDTLAIELDSLQDLLYADRRHKLLIILQGTDTSGKDGTIRSVFGRTTALGVHAIGWKAPSEAELAHDYLWRIHQHAPAAGEVMIFNRSQYEDVLVPVVNGWITPEQTKQRYAHINDFERMLTETGTTVMKFMLHISFKEQGARLQERIDDPTKRWKFSHGDVEVRKQWADYQKAYAALLGATSTAYAPWTVVPADSKTHRNLMIATMVRDKLKSLGLKYPPDDPKMVGLKIK
jgi:PPK2 family polyphosphate:nucleotide phosphotransferase